MKSNNPPLSPHLQIYSLRLHMAMSIFHRITGVALSLGSLLVVYWLGAAAYGPATYETAVRAVQSPLGLLLLFGWSFALFYHMCNGIRHLIWDAGALFEKDQIKTSGAVTLAAAVGLTAVCWIVGLAA